MKRILFVDMHRYGRSPSQRFRYEQYIELLKIEGYVVHHSFLLTKWDDQYFYQSGQIIFKGLILFKSILKRLRDIAQANSYDFIFIQREAFFLGTTFFEKSFSRSRAKVIFDFDDSIWLNQISNSAPNKRFNFLKKTSKVSEIIKLSDTVVVGNRYLFEYAMQFNKNVRLIPTTIDTDIYTPLSVTETDKNKITIGWSGSKTTIDHFREAIPVLQHIKGKYKNQVQIKVMGDASFSDENLDASSSDWRLETEIEDLRTFDIGIMPLPDDEWSRGKCGLKGLQYMALEIPTIMSRVGINSEIIDNGVNGFLASTKEEWVQSLSILINDKTLRKQMGEKGREKVINHYSVDSNKDNFLSLFS